MPGGTIALLVAIDIHLGYVLLVSLKDTKTDAFIAATRKIIKEFAGTKTTVQKLLSDNGKQFRARKYLEFCTEPLFSTKLETFTTTYNLQGNPAERVVWDLGEKFRLTFNNKNNELIDHTSWDEHIKKINFVLNHTPKTHGYTPAEVLGMQPFALLKRQKLLPRVHSPTENLKKEIAKIVMNSKSYAPSVAPRSKSFKFTNDVSGYVHV